MTGEDTWTADALSRGDVDVVRQRIEQDADFIHRRDALGDTPLITAIAFDDPDLVEFMLHQGADPNVVVQDGYTCLLSAVESDGEHSERIVRLLIAAGAEIDQPGVNGWTALHMAAARGEIDKARLLIAAGAQVDRRTEIDGEETPLMEAAFMGHPGTVRLLLECGADPNLCDTVHGRNALQLAQYAAAGPDPDVCEFLADQESAPQAQEVDDPEFWRELDLSEPQIEAVREQLQDVDLLVTYQENAERIVRDGNHDEAIEVLERWLDRSEG